jgi:hypothetical protein
MSTDLTDVINLLESKSFRAERKIQGPVRKFTPAQMEELRGWTVYGFFSFSFLRRARLGRSDATLRSFSLRMKVLCLIADYRTVRQMENGLNPYVVAQIPGFGSDKFMALLFDVFDAFSLEFQNTKKLNVLFGPAGNGSELADRIGLP